MDHVINFFIILFIVCCFLISNTSRILGNKKGVNQDSLFLIGFLFGLVNGLTRFAWGFLMDKFGFKILNIIISCIEITVSWTIYFSAQNNALYIIENLLVACCLSGTFTTITPLFNKIFGKELATEIYGLTGFFIGVASILGPLLIKVVIPKSDPNHPETDKNLDGEYYFILYVIGGGISLMKFIALICFKEDEPYQFKKGKEGDVNIKERLEDDETINKN